MLGKTLQHEFRMQSIHSGVFDLLTPKSVFSRKVHERLLRVCVCVCITAHLCDIAFIKHFYKQEDC